VDWYRSALAPPIAPATKIFSLSGHVNRPGQLRAAAWAPPFRELIFEHGGGIPDGRKVKAIMPAGASSSLIVADEKALDTPMDYESVPSSARNLDRHRSSSMDDSVGIDWVINKTSALLQARILWQMYPMP
jgi:NADH-quinone oxidoreductase subunit F